MADTNPTYLTCPTCGRGQFMLARRMYTLPLADGTPQRNWASGENSSNDIVCADCATHLRWDEATHSFLRVPKP